MRRSPPRLGPVPPRFGLLLPRFGSLLIVILLLQWAAAPAACLAAAQPDAAWSGQPICHAPDSLAPDSPAPSSPASSPAPDTPPAHHAGMECPLCAPLPPGLLPTTPLLARSAIVAPAPYTAPATPRPPTLATRPTPQQPRAPPAYS